MPEVSRISIEKRFLRTPKGETVYHQAICMKRAIITARKITNSSSAGNPPDLPASHYDESISQTGNKMIVTATQFSLNPAMHSRMSTTSKTSRVNGV